MKDGEIIIENVASIFIDVGTNVYSYTLPELLCYRRPSLRKYGGGGTIAGRDRTTLACGVVEFGWRLP